MKVFLYRRLTSARYIVNLIDFCLSFYFFFSFHSSYLHYYCFEDLCLSSFLSFSSLDPFPLLLSAIFLCYVSHLIFWPRLSSHYFSLILKPNPHFLLLPYTSCVLNSHMEHTTALDTSHRTQDHSTPIT